jgi:hypothetical protein
MLALTSGTGNARAEAPAFTSVQRFDATSVAGLELAGTANERGEFVRIEAHAQAVHPQWRVGGYFRLPYSMSHGGGDPAFDIPNSSTAIGKLSIGGLWVPYTRTSGVSVVLHAGAAVPIAGRSIIDRSETRQVAMVPIRPHDAYDQLPGVWTVGAGASVLITGATSYGRIDTGVDVVHESETSTRRPGIHVNGALGTRIGSHAGLALEVSALHGSPGQSFVPRLLTEKDAVLATCALSYRHRFRHVQLYGAFVFPITEAQSAVAHFWIVRMGAEWTF